MPRTYDLQVHTDASPCSSTPPEAVVRAARRAGLDGIAVTDHDTLSNVEAVREAAPPELTVIPAVEVTTTEGHLLALDVREAPPRADPLTVVDDVHDQGGVAVLSHPFDRWRQYYRSDLSDLAAAVDAVEAVNSRCVRGRFNERAAAYAEARGLPRTGGSDAHFPMEVGRAYTLVEDDAGSLPEAIRSGRVSAAGRGRYLSGHVATKVTQFRAASGRLAAKLPPNRMLER